MMALRNNCEKMTSRIGMSRIIVWTLILLEVLLSAAQHSEASDDPTSNDLILDVTVSYDTAYRTKLAVEGLVSDHVTGLMSDVNATLLQLRQEGVDVQLRGITALDDGLLVFKDNHRTVVSPNKTARKMSRTVGVRVPGADVVLVLSGREIGKGERAHKDGGTYPLQLCNQTLYAVVVIKSSYQESVFVVTRFLAKLLGAKYDEDHDDPKCKSQQGSIMGEYPRLYPPTGYTFTNCSKQEIKDSVMAMKEMFPACSNAYSSGNLPPR